MRTLTKDETDQVSGGVGALGAGIGFAVGFVGKKMGGGSNKAALAAGVLGAVSGAAGNLAGSAAAGGLFVRGAWGLRSIGTGVAGSLVPPRLGPYGSYSSK